VLFESGAEWHGRLLSQAFASVSPCGILHPSFKTFNHEVKEPRQVQRTLAKICFGIFFSGKKGKRNNSLRANEFPSPTIHHVEFRDHFHHCRHWTMNLEARSWLKLTSSFKLQINAPSVQMWQTSQWQLCCALSRCVSCRLFKIYGVVNNDLILFSMLVIYFKINILVDFCLVSVCFALLTNYYEGLNNASSGSLHGGPMQST